jgi:branched-chain amino acid transport system substrate-binding protein
MQPYLESQKVPFLMITSAGTQTNPPKPYSFSAITPAELYGAAMFKYAWQTLNKKSIAIIYQNDSFGQSGLTGAHSGASSVNARIVAEIPAEGTATEYSAQIALAKKANPDAVLLFTTVPPTAGILKEAKRTGFNTTFVESVAAATPAMLKLAGSAAEGIYAAFVWPPPDAATTDTGLKSFQTLMTTDAGVAVADIGQEYAMPFVNLQLTIEAIRRAGPNLTRDSFIKALEGMKNYKVDTTAPISFKKYDANDQFSRLGNSSVGFAVVENGAFKRINNDWISALQK